jgi:hypothetical protein
MWAIGVVPEYQERAVEANLHGGTQDVPSSCGSIRLEVNHTSEDTLRMVNAIHNLGLQDIRCRRLYETPTGAPA